MSRQQIMGLVARSAKNKQKTYRLILNLTNLFAEEIRERVNAYDGDCYSFEYLQASEFVNKNYEKFKDELFEGINSLFKITELKLLNISDQDSRNYDIAFKKLADHYNYFLEHKNHYITFTENAKIVSNILNQLSKDFEEMTDPNSENYHTAKDRRKFVKDYNAISEMFIN